MNIVFKILLVVGIVPVLFVGWIGIDQIVPYRTFVGFVVTTLFALYISWGAISAALLLGRES